MTARFDPLPCECLVDEMLAEGTARARADSWARMLAFLRGSLAPAPQP